MTKRILVLGATGRTGGHVLSFALEQGYHITALVRNPEKITIQSDRLTVIKGLPSNLGDVREALKDCDAVISLLSALSEKESFSLKKITPKHTLEMSIANVIKVMKELGIKRILTLSSIGVGDSYQYAPWFMKIMIKITNFRMVFADHNAQERLLQSSGLNWTIARPVALNENKVMKTLVVSYDRTPKPFKMSRRQLAKFFIEHLDTKLYIQKAPILSEV